MSAVMGREGELIDFFHQGARIVLVSGAEQTLVAFVANREGQGVEGLGVSLAARLSGEDEYWSRARELEEAWSLPVVFASEQFQQWVRENGAHGLQMYEALRFRLFGNRNMPAERASGPLARVCAEHGIEQKAG